jgi:hypothetical protein
MVGQNEYDQRERRGSGQPRSKQRCKAGYVGTGVKTALKFTPSVKCMQRLRTLKEQKAVIKAQTIATQQGVSEQNVTNKVTMDCPLTSHRT